MCVETLTACVLECPASWQNFVDHVGHPDHKMFGVAAPRASGTQKLT